MKGFETEHTIWRIVDNHWVNVSREFVLNKNVRNTDLFSGVLADYLWMIGFDIPETIMYCIAENSDTYMKFRRYGGNIDIFIRPL